MRCSAAIALIGLLGCTVGHGGGLPGRIEVPAATVTAQRELFAARSLFERGFGRQALVATEALVAGHPDYVDAQRLRQDILRSRGRIAALRAEAAERVARHPDSGLAHYLLGRLLPAGSAAQRQRFAQAARLAPESLYPWLGQAYALRATDPESALRLYAQLYRATDGHPTVAVALAASLRASGQLREALAIYQRLAEDELWGALGQLGAAQTLLAIGGAAERDAGFEALLAALRARPFDPGAHAVVRELLRVGVADEQVGRLVDLLRADPARLADFGRQGGLQVLVALLRRAGQPHLALAALQQAAVSPRQPALRREQRRLLLQIGDVDGFLAMLAADLPRDLLADERNQVRGLWLALLDGPWCDGAALADVARATALTAALRDTGLLVEAELVAGIALQRFGGEPAALRAVRDEVARELAFENELRRLVQENYSGASSRSLDDVVARVREASRRILGEDVVGEDRRFSVPLIGEMLDPFTAGLCRHLQRYNRHLVLGRRSGGVPEGLSFTRLSLRDLPAVAGLDLPGRCLEVIGVDRDVRSLSGVLGGDLAGVALLNHYVIDYDAVTEWADGLAERRRVVREDGGAALDDGALIAALPSEAGGGPLRPLDVAWRLAAVSSRQDSELDAAVLALIRLHERRHLVDSFHYLPIEANLWRGLGLLLGLGLSPAAVEAEMERRAELAALALGPDPELVLAHIADFMAESDEASPHVQGFAALGAQLVQALQDLGVPAEQAAAGSWHRLDAATVRRAAQRLLDELP